MSDCRFYAVHTCKSAVLKNAIDWASRPPNVFAGKAAAILSAGGGFGGGLAQHHLRQIGVFLDLHYINKPELMVHAFQPPAKFDEEGNLIDPQVSEKLKQLLLSLRDFALRLRGWALMEQCCGSWNIQRESLDSRFILVGLPVSLIIYSRVFCQYRVV